MLYIIVSLDGNYECEGDKGEGEKCCSAETPLGGAYFVYPAIETDGERIIDSSLFIRLTKRA